MNKLDLAFKIIDAIFLIIIIALFVYVIPIMQEEKKACETCNRKLLCEAKMIQTDLCRNYTYEIPNITLNISMTK
jgi:hypothetical protein